jgi:GntR family transcriptional regulator
LVTDAPIFTPCFAGAKEKADAVAIVAAEPRAVPRYQQVYAALRRRIEGGEWPVGHQIPTEPELMQRFGVSRGTLRQAIDALVREGLLKRMQGVGTFVRRPLVALGFLGFFHLFDDLRKRGFAVSLRLISSGVQPADAEVASRLDVPEATPLVMIRRLVLLDGDPFRVDDYFAPAARFGGVLDADLEKEALSDVVEQRFGVRFLRLQRWLAPALVRGEEARLLGLEPGDPVLEIEVLSHGVMSDLVSDLGLDLTDGDAGEPIDFRRIYMRGDKCRFFVEVEHP